MRYLSFKAFSFFVLSVAFLNLTPTDSFADHRNNQERSCTKTAKFLNYSCGFAARDDYLTGIAVCLNQSDNDSQRNCLTEARTTQFEAYRECRDVFRARKDLCNAVGEEPYDPPFGEEYVDSFVNPLDIGNSVTPNPYFPLTQGNKWVYEGTSINDEGEEETETIVVTVKEETKLIEGVTCVTVNDIVVINDVVVEDTDDWYAQDVSGNVWYCGEIVLNYELFEGDNPLEPEITDIDGSWKAGRNGAKAGISLPFSPTVGEFYRQEVDWGIAEDVIEVIDVNGTETSPAGSCNNDCLVTYDFTPLDTNANENKYYAPGIGRILEVDLNNGDRVELIEFTNTNTP
jgi:hypothetical protein